MSRKKPADAPIETTTEIMPVGDGDAYNPEIAPISGKIDITLDQNSITAVLVQRTVNIWETERDAALAHANILQKQIADNGAKLAAVLATVTFEALDNKIDFLARSLDAVIATYKVTHDAPSQNAIARVMTRAATIDIKSGGSGHVRLSVDVPYPAEALAILAETAVLEATKAKWVALASNLRAKLADTARLERQCAASFAENAMEQTATGRSMLGALEHRMAAYTDTRALKTQLQLPG